MCAKLRQMLADCEQYLKDGETPAQRIERERRDTEAVLNLLIRERAQERAHAGKALQHRAALQQRVARTLPDQRADRPQCTGF